jgi:hypothetical protein
LGSIGYSLFDFWRAFGYTPTNLKSSDISDHGHVFFGDAKILSNFFDRLLCSAASRERQECPDWSGDYPFSNVWAR